MIEDLSPKQAKTLVESTARLNIWEGAVRSGKSFSSLIRWLQYVQEAPPGNLIMVAKTYASLKRNIIDEICELIGKDARYYSGKGELQLWGRRIYLVGASDERSEGKIRGATFSGAYIDEVTLIPESFFTMLLSRLSVTGAKLFGTTNPDSYYHWFKRNYLDRKTELDLQHWKFTLDDNPSLSEEFKTALKKEYIGLWYQRYILGEWVTGDGAIYDFFNPSIHCIDYPANNAVRYIVGVDVGCSNPTAFVLIGINDGAYPRLWIEDEIYVDPAKNMAQATDTELVDKLREFIEGKNVTHIYVDPAAAFFKAECSYQGVRDVFDASNDVIDGIRFTSNLLANGTLKICKQCKNLIQEISTYAWDPKATDRGIEKPLKRNDHAVDAMRYAIYTHFQSALGEHMSVDRYRSIKQSIYGEGNTLSNPDVPRIFK